MPSKRAKTLRNASLAAAAAAASGALPMTNVG